MLNGLESLNATFEAILSSEAFTHLEPEVVSSDPWIVVFKKFLSPEEVQAYDEYMFSTDEGWVESPAGFQGKSSSRNSETAFCTGRCDTAEIVLRIRKRASNVTGAPLNHFDFTQGVRYKPGMFFKKHHDNHPTFHLLPCGSRVFTMFVYLKSPEKGGETSFPDLGIKVPPIPGTAVLWANTVANEDMNRYNDKRVDHASEEVVAGEKHGLNLWIYQYEFRDEWKKDCVSIQFADRLDAYLRGARVPQERRIELVFNNALDFEVSIFWRNEPDEVPVGSVLPGKEQSLSTSHSHRFVVRDTSGKFIKNVVVTIKDGTQLVNLLSGEIRDSDPKDEL